jgi:hypothetical protein
MARLTCNAHCALPRRRARCVPDGLVSGRFSSAAARLLSASAMSCCRSSLPCRDVLLPLVTTVQIGQGGEGSRAAPVRGAGSGAPRAGLWPGEARTARPRRPGRAAFIMPAKAARSRLPRLSLSCSRPPRPGRLRRRKAIGFAEPGPADPSHGCGAYQEDGDQPACPTESGVRDLSRVHPTSGVTCDP